MQFAHRYNTFWVLQSPFRRTAFREINNVRSFFTILVYQMPRIFIYYNAKMYPVHIIYSMDLEKFLLAPILRRALRLDSMHESLEMKAYTYAPERRAKIDVHHAKSSSCRIRMGPIKSAEKQTLSNFCSSTYCVKKKEISPHFLSPLF